MAESCCKRMRIDSTSFAIVDANHSYLIEYDLVSNDGTDVVNGRVLYDGVRNVLTIRGDKSMWDVVSFGGFSRLRFNCPDGKSIDIKSSVGPELSWISCSTSSGTKVIDDVDKILAGVGDDNDDVMTGRGSPSEDGKFAGQIYSDSLNGKVYVWLGSEWADDTSTTWDDVSGKPETFAPSEHTHTASQITDLPSVPTKTSDLTNDSGFTTKTYVDGLVGDVETLLAAL